MAVPVLTRGQLIEATGFAAAFCTTTAFVPQLLRVLRLKSAREISLGTFLLFSIGVSLWLVYGIYAHSMPVVVSNGATLVVSLSILVLKIKYDGGKRGDGMQDDSQQAASAKE